MRTPGRQTSPLARLEQPFNREPLQRLTHRCSAGAHLHGEIGFQKTRPLMQPSSHDFAPNLIRDDLRKGAVCDAAKLSQLRHSEDLAFCRQNTVYRE